MHQVGMVLGGDHTGAFQTGNEGKFYWVCSASMLDIHKVHPGNHEADSYLAGLGFSDVSVLQS